MPTTRHSPPDPVTHHERPACHHFHTESGEHISRRAWKLLGIACLLGCGTVCQAQTGSSTDALFPAAVKPWKLDRNRLVRGIRQSERLRCRLLEKDAEGKTCAENLCSAVTRFQEACRIKLSDGKPVNRFMMTRDRLHMQLTGKVSLPPDLFQAFTGRWFGQWDGTDVNHDWHPSERFDPPKLFAEPLPKVSVLQYAWIGNGFGWNMLMSLDGSGHKNYVLGMVYYVDRSNDRDITGEKPHVGFADSPTRLVWITDHEVFLEEVLQATKKQAELYVITAFTHDLLAAKPRVSDHGTQAVYTHNPKHRPAFRKFRW